MEDDKILINYKSVCMRKSDISCFDDFRYLNDLSISFYYEILNEKFKQFGSQFILLDPSPVSTIFFDDDIDDLKDCFGALNLESREYIFIPINDTTDKYAYGSGNHWALVVYIKKRNTFYYLDSMKLFIKNTNSICIKINSLIGESTPAKIEEVKIIKLQQNTFDCGVFVLRFSEIFLENIFGFNDKEESKLLNSIKNYSKEVDFSELFNENTCGHNLIYEYRKHIRTIAHSMIRKK